MSGESFIKLTLILAFTGTKNQHVLSYNPYLGDRTFFVFFNANGASVYRASLARQQGIVVAGCKSSSLEIRRISLLKATRSALKIEMIFEGGQKVL